MFKYMLSMGAAATLLLGLTASTKAVPLPPGGTTGVPTGTAIGSIIDSATFNFSFSGKTGTLQEEVVRTASGKLDFLYQVTFTSGSGSIASLTVGNLTGLSTSVFQNQDGRVQDPTTGFPAPGSIFVSGKGNTQGHFA